MLTQTIINPPFFYSFRETHTELIPRYCSVYPGVPCTIQLPNTRLHFFLAELAVAACHVLSVPRTAQAPAESVALHPASCILHPTSCILHPALGLGMEAVGEPTPRAQHLLQVTAWSCQCRNFWLLWCKNNQKGPKECHEFRVRFKGALLLPPLLYQALTAH